MDLIEYQPSQDGTSYNPVVTPNLINALEEEARRQQSADQRNLRMLEANNRQRVENAKFAGQDLIALSKFSKSLTETLTKQYKRTQDDIAIGEVYDTIVGGVPEGVALQEAEAITSADEQRGQVEEAATEVLEETGDEGAAELVRRDLGGAAKGIHNERGALMAAQVAYPGFMEAWINSDSKITINGDTMTVAQALATGDPRIIASVIAMGRSQFIKQYGLTGATKTNVVRYLADTILTTDARVTSAVQAAATKAEREQELSDLNNTTYGIGQNFEDANSQATWNDVAEQYWNSGLFTTRAAANEAAIAALLKPMIEAGDVDSITALENTLKVDGQKGSELGNQYRELFAQAKEEAGKKETQNLTQTVRDIESSMYESLSDVTDPDARVAIINEAIEQLEEAGAYQAARALRGQLQALQTDGANSYNYTQLSDQIRDGELRDPKDIENAYNLGRITQQQRDQLLGQLSEATNTETPTNPRAAALAGDYADRFESDLLTSVGLQRDAQGNYFDPLTAGSAAPLNPGEAKILVGAAKRELNLVLNEVITNNPGLASDPVALDEALRTAAQNWYQENVLNRDGKYGAIRELGELRSQAGNTERQDELTEELRNIVNSPSYLSTVDGSVLSTGPRDLTHTVLSEANVNLYNPLRGDRLFPRTRMDFFIEEYNKGIIAPQVAEYADLLGMTPVALLQQQVSAWGLEPLKAPEIGGQSNKNFSTPEEGAQYLMTIGVPARGAAWLSGNIAQESSWNGQRRWGEVMGDGSTANGGLVSWSNQPGRGVYRLDEIERRLGKPVTQATDAEQLQAMLEEMRTNYPSAYATFMNPYATDRQLMDASIAYWGYGEEGSRYEIARSVEQNL